MMVKYFKIFVWIFLLFSLFLVFASNQDTDWDWIIDNIDKCPAIKWVNQNLWCPILSQSCLPNSEINNCKTWFSCSLNWYCEAEIPSDLVWTCIYPQNWSSVFWNVICDSYPCDFKFDFFASIRKCDVILPAIVSPDWSQIYWKWNIYPLPYNY